MSAIVSLRNVVKTYTRGKQTVVVSHPIFLSEGCAVEDFNWPDRIVLGTASSQAVSALKALYRPLVMRGVPVIVTNHETAELVREINREKAMIVVEHDMQFIRKIAKKVTVFNQGGVLVEDSVENILRNPLVRDIYLGKQAVA